MYDAAEATATRDAWAKGLYGHLFDLLIRKANEKLGGGREAGRGRDATFIGVLDIFGFEKFTTNSFEQLCINFCNGACDHLRGRAA